MELPIVGRELNEKSLTKNVPKNRRFGDATRVKFKRHTCNWQITHVKFANYPREVAQRSTRKTLHFFAQFVVMML